MAVGATAGLAVVVDAQPAPQDPVTRSAGVADQAPMALNADALVLPPATEQAVDLQVAAAAQQFSSEGAGQSVSQTIQLTIVGGSLELAVDAATVTLARMPGSHNDWTGTLPPVRVVDARGTHEGWNVRWTVASLDVVGATSSSHAPDARVHLEPGEPVVIAGTPDGLTSGKPSPAVRYGRTLFAAAPGSGGGTYEAGGTLSVRLPDNLDADSIVVELAFILD